MWRDLRQSILVLLALLLCAGCGGAATAPPPVATPSPTIAGAALRSSPTPPGARAAPTAPAVPPASPAALPTAAGQATASARPGGTAQAASFVYLWPAYLPEGMQVSPSESRVAREGELGEGGIGFFIVTFKNTTQKLVVGGGATATLPLTGEQRRVVAGSRQGTLTTNGDQRQIVFDVPQGSLFVYSFGLSEAELLRVAESLRPLPVREVRQRAGVQ